MAVDTQALLAKLDEIAGAVASGKGAPVLAISRTSGSADNKTSPVDAQHYTGLLVDMVPSQGASITSLSVQGAPNKGGPWIQEGDPNAFQATVNPASGPQRFIVANVSAWIAVVLGRPNNWDVWITPTDLSGSTTINVTGTSSENLIEYASAPVGPTNPLDTRDVHLPAALGQAAMSASLAVVIASNQTATPVTPAATEAHLGAVGGALVTIEAHVQRPADVNAYAANDVISDSASAPTAAYLTFTGMARVAGGSGYITKAVLQTDLSTCTLPLRLHLFSVVPATINDNSPMTVLFANRLTYVGALTFPAAATEGTGSDMAYALDIVDRLPFACANGDANLYGMLETTVAGVNGTTQKSGQNFSLRLSVDQN